MTITTNIEEHLHRAHIVLTATNAVLPFIASRHLRGGALVWRRIAALQHCTQTWLSSGRISGS